MAVGPAGRFCARCASPDPDDGYPDAVGTTRIGQVAFARGLVAWSDLAYSDPDTVAACGGAGYLGTAVVVRMTRAVRRTQGAAGGRGRDAMACLTCRAPIMPGSLHGNAVGQPHIRRRYGTEAPRFCVACLTLEPPGPFFLPETTVPREVAEQQAGIAHVMRQVLTHRSARA